ncbi:MAG: DNA-binding protein [Ruminococcaceae bacterium]|nr:DNA-binding protein [Oscillospiraceae bacterium]
MKTKSVEMTLLFDLYGELLTAKQQQLFDLYYNEDLSLAEIADLLQISRQGARDGIVRAENLLREFDETLALTSTMEQNSQIAALANQIILSSEIDEVKKLAEQIKSLALSQGGNYGI